MVWFTQMICYNVYIPLLIREANNVEENPGRTIFDIIDTTTIVSAALVFFQLRATVIERSRFIYLSIMSIITSVYTIPYFNGNKYRYTTFFEEIM